MDDRIEVRIFVQLVYSVKHLKKRAKEKKKKKEKMHTSSNNKKRMKTTHMRVTWNSSIFGKLNLKMSKQ